MPPEMAPDVAAVVRLLERVRQRLLVRHVLQGTAWAAGLSVVLWLAVASLGRSPSLAILLVLAVGPALLAIVLRKRRTLSHVAARIERAWPACRNIVVTAEELVNDDGRPEWVRSRVLRDAAAGTRSYSAGRDRAADEAAGGCCGVAPRPGSRRRGGSPRDAPPFRWPAGLSHAPRPASVRQPRAFTSNPPLTPGSLRRRSTIRRGSTSSRERTRASNSRQADRALAFASWIVPSRSTTGRRSWSPR